MSQHHVEQAIGRLVTDEGFRRRFAADPPAAIQRLVDAGFELNPCERRALVSLDPRRLARFAETVDPCILKVELRRTTP